MIDHPVLKRLIQNSEVWFYKKLLRILKHRILPEIVREFYETHGVKDIDKQMQQIATQSSARYALKHMGGAKSLHSKFEVIDFALQQVTITDGLFCEFGVFRGETLNYLAERITSDVHGFDSFNGLPEFWREGFEQGAFTVASSDTLTFRKNTIIHKGLFEDTLPSFTTSFPQPVAFLHIDCDLYSSTTTVLEQLKGQIVSGSVIVFDEYFNYPHWHEHEFRAFQDFIRNYSITYDYIGYNRRDEQVAVIIR